MLTGNEAVAWAAIEAGVDFFSHYPGSPVNNVEPVLKKLNKEQALNIVFNDSLNEHIAVLAAAGASYCGARSMVVMKHVGLNVAADPVNYLGYTGIKGGMVIVVGTDPGANSSTGEEDPHWYIPQVSFPSFEPKNVADIQRLTVNAYEISEKYELPVFVFISSRIANHADSLPLPSPRKTLKNFRFQKDPARYINVGEKAVINHRKQLEKITALGENEDFLQSLFDSRSSVALITRGVTFGHAYESILRLNLENQVQLLNLDLIFPINRKKLLEHLKQKETIYFIEDQDGFLENQVKMHLFNDLDCQVYGKEYFPAHGEITFHQVHDFLARIFHKQPVSDKKSAVEIQERLGTFCEGCPHRSAFYVIDRVIEGTDYVIGGDIGCSSLPPQRADWLLCMNAGIGISQGMTQILQNQKVISTGGEGSFFHAGLIALQSAVLNKIDLLHLVFDNRSIAMTGHQASPTADPRLDPIQLLRSIGVERAFLVDAFDPISFQNRLKAELHTKGVRVLWVRGDCALQPDEETRLRRKTKFIRIENSKCGSCTKCYSELGCPAIQLTQKGARDLWIDMDRCMRCGVCIEICPHEAIEARYEKAPL